ncbi:transglutaminase family protein [Cellulomonas iranensis]|uniref:Transglutaminase-like putative cysteine protease n=1 Tax=Cellulomonas iranensis TaxID=76862 RepID=A0ABU0GIH6_9CELL|nr:transglutaminase family protein [Cellulomonas iranensis]MDQ0425128.1 transglutaminase-like putative cysteine protease [Cellulomonas iranensis]
MSVRTYDLVHRTTYEYPQPVTDSYGRTTMTPRDLPDQRVLSTSLTIDPAPADTGEHVDWFGSTTTYFGVTTPHTRLVVTSRSTLEVSRTVPPRDALPDVGWRAVARAVTAGDLGALRTDAAGLVAVREAVLPSTHVTFVDEVRDWAAPSFAQDRPLADVVVDLVHRIRTELTYRSGSTTVHTTQTQLLAQGAGVCQDFAHLMIAALRLHGLPARYASGYIETRPRPGRPKLRGADASHAWVSVWLPGHGWLDADPTNDQLVDDRYVVLGWGRDYHDVPPLRGVIFTDGRGATPRVEVDLVPAGSAPFV